jgi:hypothetical protein
MGKGGTHGDVEQRTIPEDSEHFNSALAISSFLGQVGRLSQNWGVSARVDVMLHSMGKIWHHTTDEENRRTFL